MSGTSWMRPEHPVTARLEDESKPDGIVEVFIGATLWLKMLRSDWEAFRARASQPKGGSDGE